MIKLRGYQEEAVDSIFGYFEVETGNPLIVLPTGSGKSIVIGEFVNQASRDYPTERFMLLSHVKEILVQNAAKIRDISPDVSLGIYSAGLKRRDKDKQITVAGIASVYKKAAQFGHISLILIDECFTSDTMISTPTGDVRIDQIRPGDVVHHALGDGVVEAVSQRSTYNIYELEFSDGRTICCTGNHRIFTANGWKKASALEIGEITFGREDLRQLWEELSPLAARKPGYARGQLEQAEVLLHILLEEAREPHGRSGSAPKDEGPASRNRSQAAETGREWPTPVFAPSGAGSCARRGVGIGSRRTNKNPEGERLSDVLQNRHRESRVDDRDRDKWRQSLLDRASNAGSKEARSSRFPRLVRISRVQRASPVPVFNLQVEGHPSYFANGKLAHNCHLVPKASNGMYRTFIDGLREINPKLKIVGFSATPYRLDSGMLHERNEHDKEDQRIFTDIAYEANVKDLVDQGYLSPLVSQESALRPDLEGMKLKGGEFVQRDLEAMMDVDWRVESAVKEAMRLCAERNKWMFFCCSVRHAEHVRDVLENNGISAACVTGTTPHKQRDRILRDFKAGKYRALTNMNVLTTGFDAPDIDAIILMRPTMSTGLYCQMVGRGMRMHETKTDTLVLDFADNILQHGPIDNLFIQSQSSQKKKPESDEPRDKDEKDAREYDPNHKSVAASHSVLTGDGPSYHTVKVDRVSYRYHHKPGKRPSLRVDYKCGLVTISEWVCLEHDGYPKTKARKWWTRRASHHSDFVPDTVQKAMLLTRHLLQPKEIVVDRTPKYPKIVEWNELHKPPKEQPHPRLCRPSKRTQEYLGIEYHDRF